MQLRASIPASAVVCATGATDGAVVGGQEVAMADDRALLLDAAVLGALTPRGVVSRVAS
jgi:hypothetical protein